MCASPQEAKLASVQRKAAPFRILGPAAILVACNGGPTLASQAHGPIECAGGGSMVNLGPCCGQVAKQVSTASLPVNTCEGGSTAYSLCQGQSFACEFVCSLPDGYKVVPAGQDAGWCGVTTDGAADGPPPSATAVPFDGGSLSLGPCRGQVVALIPATACPAHCPGSLAYAVCKDGAYTECACDIPPGYTLVPLSDGEPPDAAGADAADGRPGDSSAEASPPVEAGDGGG